MEAAGFTEEAEQELRELLSNKNYFGVEELVEGITMEEPLKKLFALLGSFETDIDELAEAKSLAENFPKILSAITELKNTYPLNLESSAIIITTPESFLRDTPLVQVSPL